MNKVVLMGRLAKDPELRFAATTGKAVTRITVAVTRKVKDANGNYGADFINCIAFNKGAELIAEHFVKGSRICLSGSIQTGAYDKDGKKIYTTDVIINDFDFIDSKNKSGASTDNSFNPAGNSFDNSFSGGFNDDMMQVDTGDIPF